MYVHKPVCVIAQTVWQSTSSFVQTSATNARKMSHVQLQFHPLLQCTNQQQSHEKTFTIWLHFPHKHANAKAMNDHTNTR